MKREYVFNNFFTLINQLLICFSVFFPLNKATGQIRSDADEEHKRLYYDYTARVKKFKDMKDFRDVFHYNKLLLGKKRILGNISYNTGRVLVDDGQVTHTEIRNAIGFFTRIRFFEEFCINTTFYKEFNPKADAIWIANYNYSIGRYNWRPNRFNYGYENYINNRYSDNFQAFSDKFLEGYYFVSYNHSSEKLNQKIRMDSTTSLKFIYFVRYSIKYINKDLVLSGSLWNGKSTLGTALRFTMFRNIYIETAVYYYPEETIKKQPWDPDYTYGFGYFDYRSFRVSLTYGNWAVNRFPWNKKYYSHYNFLDGDFRITANWIW
jgi:hypothetical protein